MKSRFADKPEKPAPQLPLLADSDEITLSGTLERVIFHNEENGYTVFRLVPEKPAPREPRVKGAPARDFARDPVSCVGHMVNPQTGVKVTVHGRWVNNPRFGRQIAFDTCEEVLPATAEGIRLYLASGLIRGVGEGMANRIVDAFGTDTIRILDEEPERLKKIRGIGAKNYERIHASWMEHRGIRDLMLFLQPHGITPAYAVRIYRTYGADALSVVRENPYRLAMEIRGIGFVTADAAAAKLGFEKNDPLRIEAGALYVLQKSTDEVNVYLPEEMLVQEACEQLQVGEGQVRAAIERLEAGERVVIEERALAPDGGSGAERGVFLKRYFHYESKIAFYLNHLLHSPKSVFFPNADQAADKVIAQMPIALAPEQAEAVRTAAKCKVMVLTGGPGTGKTTIINAIIKLFEQKKARILLAAPTGRAAKRMAETSGREARTIHRLLEYSPQEDGFARNENVPLACGLLVVDEASMMDTLLFYHLLKAVPLGCTVVLVGDVFQLPSVGPGTVLADIIASGILPVVRLTEIFRQSAESAIIRNAHLINKGEIPPLESSPDRLSDFYFIHSADPEKAAELIVDLVRSHIPRRFGLDPVTDIQVLTPMHNGAVGTNRMNERLQAALNPNGLEVRRGDRAFRLHDKVMQIRNNYDKDVFNGDMGRISHIDTAERTLSVTCDERVIPYEFDELDELVPAYAISIHKSQGSEYPAVVIPLMMQHYLLLQRNLVYTGVTRGKKLVVLVGEPRALAMAVRNNKTRKRWTRLAWRLASDG